MIRPSRERIALLARQIVDELARDENTHLLRDRDTLRQSVIQALTEELRHDEIRVMAVEARLAALADAPRRGTKEWQALWQKMLDDEYERTRFESL